jgi:hypothetical protein
MKKISVIMLYLAPINFRSTVILGGYVSIGFHKHSLAYPAIAADPRFVLSIRLAQYRTPRVETSRRSTFRTMLFCSVGEYSAIRASLESAEGVCSMWSPSLDFSRSS